MLASPVKLAKSICYSICYSTWPHVSAPVPEAGFWRLAVLIGMSAVLYERTKMINELSANHTDSVGWNCRIATLTFVARGGSLSILDFGSRRRNASVRADKVWPATMFFVFADFRLVYVVRHVVPARAPRQDARRHCRALWIEGIVMGRTTFFIYTERRTGAWPGGDRGQSGHEQVVRL